MKERLALWLQYLMPQRGLTVFAGWVASGRWGAITQRIITRFVRRYNVNMAEALEPNPQAYTSFNDFFTRALKPGARPIADAPWVCPVD